MSKTNDCKKCRRVGAKLFLKGERCNSQNCAMVKKPYSPGQKPKRRKPPLSEYGKEIIEKQKLRYWYDLREKQFARYIKRVIGEQKTAEAAGDKLLRKLEARLDNTIYRSGLATSRKEAKKMVSYGFFHVNGKPVDKPSYEVKVGDVIEVRPGKKKVFTGFAERMKNFNPPVWISLNKEKLEIKVTGEVVIEEVMPPVEISSIFEFYSR